MSRSWFRRRAATAQPRLGVVLAALALLFQTFVVQTHVETAPFASAHMVAAASASISANTHGDEAPGVCLLCQELALSGAFLHATPPALVVGNIFALVIAPARTHQAPRIFPAHAWQSRAPPTSL
ncbi:MAG: hypothetical protein ABUS57_02065 [Pseudomonadota bacterium]